MLLKLLVNKHRQKIAYLLQEGEKTDAKLVGAIAPNWQTFTHHLTRFRNRVLIHGHRRGKRVVYSLHYPQSELWILPKQIAALYAR